MSPLSPEEIEAIRASAPWVKILGSGSLLSIVVVIWKAFGIYNRLKIVEDEVTSMKSSRPLTEARHEELTMHCKDMVDAKIAKVASDLHLILLKEIQKVKTDVTTIKETQASVLGELKQISNTLKNS